MSYSGKYAPTNPHKYEGDVSQVCYRSSWELSVMAWCDTNPNVISWSSEDVVLWYLCATDQRKHRYFVDFKIKFSDNSVILVEVKPDKETKPPKKKSRPSKKHLKEVLTYVKNTSKWQAAREYALDRGWKFQIWTENHLRRLGIQILGK
jgi:hypothetical protein